MVFKLAAAAIALAAFANAANVKRVACPDGVNVASHEAVRSLHIFYMLLLNLMDLSAAHSSLSAMTSRISLTASAVKTSMSLSALPSMTPSASLRLVSSREEEPMAR